MKKSKSLIIPISFVLYVFIVAGCIKKDSLPSQKSISVNKNVNSPGVLSLTSSIQLLTDQSFQKGFNVLDPSSGAVQGPLQYTTANGSPIWTLAQWYSRSSIYGATPTILASGSYQYSNSNKAITIGPTSSSDGSLILAINGQSEFNNTYRTATQPFPALLADLKIADPDGWLGTTTPFIGAMDSLKFNIDARLLYETRNQKAGYDSTIHAIQYECTFLIQNLNSSNAGYGKSMYFMVMLYDDRYPLPGLVTSIDTFTGKFIYDVGIAPFTDSGLAVGTWKNISGDLLPLIKSGLTSAWNHGILTESQSYNDYKVSLFITGWECPGLNIGTMQIKNLSLIAK